jgi:hypothetical protein
MSAAASSACTSSAQAFANCLSRVIINPILALIFAIGLLVFIYGIVEYMAGLASDGKSKEEGKKHMLWGLIGMFIMVAAWGILRIIASTLNVPLPH